MDQTVLRFQKTSNYDEKEPNTFLRIRLLGAPQKDSTCLCEGIAWLSLLVFCLSLEMRFGNDSSTAVQVGHVRSYLLLPRILAFGTIDLVRVQVRMLSWNFLVTSRKIQHKETNIDLKSKRR